MEMDTTVSIFDDSNIFARMKDKRDIVTFVKEIEKHSCLYMENSIEYSNKVLRRRTWMEIAKKMGTTVPDCKEKWRKIRIAFMRSLKTAQKGSRPYYLANHLHFILPENRKKSKEEISEQTINVSFEKETQNDIPTKEEMIDEEISSDSCDSPSDTSHTIYMEPFEAVNPIKIQDVKQIEPPAPTYKRKNESLESDPRKMFLLSLLPDIESLSENEMRRFRREVVVVIDNIISSRDSRGSVIR